MMREHKETEMSNIIKNGKFINGLDDWKTDRLVEVGTHEQTKYVNFKPDTLITQRDLPIEGGVTWLFRLIASGFPLTGTPVDWATQKTTMQLQALSKGATEPHSDKPMMSLQFSDGGNQGWIVFQPIPAYPSWGGAGFVVDVPPEAKFVTVRLSYPAGDGQPGAPIAISNIDLSKN